MMLQTFLKGCKHDSSHQNQIEQQDIKESPIFCGYSMFLNEWKRDEDVQREESIERRFRRTWFKNKGCEMQGKKVSCVWRERKNFSTSLASSFCSMIEKHFPLLTFVRERQTAKYLWVREGRQVSFLLILHLLCLSLFRSWLLLLSSWIRQFLCQVRLRPSPPATKRSVRICHKLIPFD